MKTLLIAAALLLSAAVYAQDGERAVFVTALASQDAGAYQGTVMLVRPYRGGHVGIILNRPTKTKLFDVYPQHAPSRAVTSPLYFGGPVAADRVFAVIRSKDKPGDRVLELMPGVWLVMDAKSIDRIIDTRPNEARYYVGGVIWDEGELAEEVRKGWMAVRPADASKLFLQDTGGLYRELVPAGRGQLPTTKLRPGIWS